MSHQSVNINTSNENSFLIKSVRVFLSGMANSLLISILICFICFVVFCFHKQQFVLHLLPYWVFRCSPQYVLQVHIPPMMSIQVWKLLQKTFYLVCCQNFPLLYCYEAIKDVKFYLRGSSDLYEKTCNNIHLTLRNIYLVVDPFWCCWSAARPGRKCNGFQV